MEIMALPRTTEKKSERPQSSAHSKSPSVNLPQPERDSHMVPRPPAADAIAGEGDGRGRGASDRRR